MKYHHLNQEERDCLAVWRSEGQSLREIGRRLGRSPGSLSRELRRNEGSKGLYFPHGAQRRARHRLSLNHRSQRLKTPELRAAVQESLEKRWSPELIAGRLKRTQPELPSITAEAIYQWIYAERRDLIRWLTRSHRKRFPRRDGRKRRIHIPQRISVCQRPESIQQRTEAGHWETDLLVGPGRAALQVLVDRKTRYSRLRKIAIKTAGASRTALTRLLESIPTQLRRSVTYDNGSENAEHLILNEDFGLNSYFCEPYHSWEKATVENTNGLIRRFLPKGTRLEDVSDEHLCLIEAWLNARPRKILNFQTPGEAFEAAVALKD